MISHLSLVGVLCFHLLCNFTYLTGPKSIDTKLVTICSIIANRLQNGTDTPEHSLESIPQNALGDIYEKKTHQHSDWQEDEKTFQQNKIDCSNTTPISINQVATIHSKTLPRVNDWLFPHQQFDLKHLPNLKPQSSWTKIPQWLAGTWTANSEIILKEFNFKSGIVTSKPETIKHRTTVVYGTKQDHSGEIWQLTQQGTTKVVHRDSRSEYRLKKESSIPYISPDRIVTYSCWLVIEVEDSTKIITAVNQKEVIEEVKPLARKRLGILRSVGYFDVAGLPERRSISSVTLIRAKPFPKNRSCQEEEYLPVNQQPTADH